MTSKLQNQSLNLKLLTSLFLLTSSLWFYISVYFGYLLSKLFYNFFDTLNKDNLYEIIKFRKKFNFENILENINKFSINSILKFFKNWIIRIVKKSLQVVEAIKNFITTLKFCKKNFKSILEFKKNFQMLKVLLFILLTVLQLFRSLITEIFFLHKIIEYVIQLQQFILILMSESVLITRLIYFLYMILLGLFIGLIGTLVGFLLRIYSQNDDLYVFILIFLLEILYNNGLGYFSLEPEKIEQLSPFSLKAIEQINPRPSKLFLGESVEKPQIPFPLLGDPRISIDFDFLFEEPKNSKSKLFKFYRNVNEKIKY